MFFVCGMKDCSTLIDLHAAIQFSQYFLLNIVYFAKLFAPLYILASFVKD